MNKSIISIVFFLFYSSCSLNSADLVDAVWNHDKDTVNKLIKAGVSVNDTAGKYTPLMRACQVEDFEIIQILLRAGADVNASSSQTNPVTIAVDAGNLQILELLANNGAQIASLRINGGTLLDRAVGLGKAKVSLVGCCSCSDQTDRTHVIAYLKKIGVPITSSALYFAMYNHVDKMENFRLALKLGADPNGYFKFQIDGTTEIETTALCLATRCSRDNQIFDTIIRELIALKVNINKPNSNGQTALMIAANNNVISAAQALITAGADLDLQDNEGKTALMYACSGEYVTKYIKKYPYAFTGAMIKLLLQYQANMKPIDKKKINMLLTELEKDNYYREMCCPLIRQLINIQK